MAILALGGAAGAAGHAVKKSLRKKTMRKEYKNTSREGAPSKTIMFGTTAEKKEETTTTTRWCFTHGHRVRLENSGQIGRVESNHQDG